MLIFQQSCEYLAFGYNVVTLSLALKPTGQTGGDLPRKAEVAFYHPSQGGGLQGGQVKLLLACIPLV